MQTDGARSGRASVLGSLASIASLIAALSCCLPLGTLLMAAGSASASLFSETLRPYLLAFSVGSLIFAFIQTYFRNRCEFRHRSLRTVLLWFSALTVTGMLVFPVQFAAALAGVAPSGNAAGTLQTFDERAFVRDFNASANETRLVVLLSPT
jgi:hypothetical protein